MKRFLITFLVVILIIVGLPTNVSCKTDSSLRLIQDKLHELSANNILETYDNNKVEFLLNQAKEYAVSLLRNNEITGYELTPSSVIFNHVSGLSLIFKPIIKNTYAGETVVDDNSISIYTIQSWYDEDSIVVSPNLPVGINNDAELLPAVASNIAALDFCSYDETKSIKNIPIPFSSTDKFSLDDFGPNQIIIWQGHGCWAGSELHSVLWTKRAFDTDAYEAGGQYKIDCDAKRIVVINGYEEAITSKYIDEYCHDMTNSLIYLGQCEGGYDPVLAHAFLDKGASALIANSKTIQAVYGDIMQYTILNLLTEVNPNTSKLYTLGQALTKAKETYGENDKVVTPVAYGAEPLLFGNENYSLNKLTIPQNLYYDETKTSDRIISSINEGFDIVLPGTSEPLKTNTPGTYNAEAKLKSGYVWSDSTFNNIPFTLTISKAYTKIDDFVAPIDKKNLAYTGSDIDLVTTGTPLDKIHYGLDDPDSDDPVIYSTDVPTSLYAGTYNVVWYADGKNDNYLSYGSSENPISYFIDVDFGERENINCIMKNIYLGANIPSPTLSDPSILSDTDSSVTFYFNTENSYLDAIEWDDVDKTSLGLGTYYMYATIRDNLNVYRYYHYDTPIIEFKVTNKPISKDKKYKVPNTCAK